MLSFFDMKPTDLEGDQEQAFQWFMQYMESRNDEDPSMFSDF